MADKVAINYLHSYLERHPTRTYKKGEIIIFQGEAPRTGFVVKSGVIKAYNLSVNGDEKPIAFYTADAPFPGPWLYGKMPNAIFYYEVFSDEATVYTIAREEFVSYLKGRPELLYQELERYILDQLGSSMRLNALQHSRASDKLLYTLHYLALNHGSKLDSGLLEIDLELTHQDFANLTGLTRETAATELNKLKRQGVVSYGKQKPYRLDLQRLMQLLNDQYIADMEIHT